MRAQVADRRVLQALRMHREQRRRPAQVAWLHAPLGVASARLLLGAERGSLIENARRRRTGSLVLVSGVRLETVQGGGRDGGGAPV